MSEILSATAHRPWPLPKRSWIMFQRWHDLLFAHWAPAARTIATVSATRVGAGHVGRQSLGGVIPFWMSDVHFRGVPPIPTAACFPELNVRTYVRAPQDPDKPGVYFFSLDAASVLAVLGARAAVGLPYFWAEIHAKAAGDAIVYRSVRRQRPPGAELVASYRPTGPVSQSKTNLETFTTERYCLYVVRMGRVHRVEIHHLPWPLQPAEAEFQVNTMALASGIELPPEKPVLQFAKSLDVYIFAPAGIG